MARGNPAKGGGVEVARLTVKVSPDTKHFKRELESQLKRINRLVDGDDTANISLGADTRQMVQQVKSATKDLRATVKIDADVDRRGMLSRLADKLRGIKAPSFGSGINPMGGAVVAAGVLAVAAPAIGLITSALLTLPGLIALVATPIAALTLGMDGLKKAAETLKAPFDDLKAVMSSAVENQFLKPFETLKGIFPSLKATLPTVTQGLADMAQGFAAAITSPEGLARIENTIRNIGSALSQSVPGLTGFVNGLTTLAEGFSKKLPGLVDWFNDTGAAFDTWIQKLTNPSWLTGKSELDTIFEGLGTTLKTIMDALGGMASAGLEFMKDPKKVQDFADSLKNVGDALRGIVDASNTLNNGGLFTTALPSFDGEKAKQDFLAPFTSDSAGWRDMWAGMKTAWEETKTSFAASMEIVKTTASTAWGQVVATVQGAVASVQGAVSGIGLTISGIWSNVTSTASAAWNGVVSAVQGAWNGIVGAISSGVGNAVAAVQSMGSQIVAAITSIDLTSAGANIVQGLINGIGSMIGAAVAKAKELASSVANAVTGFLGIKSPSRLFMEYGDNTAQGFGIGLENGFGPVLDQAKALAGAVAAAFASGSDPTAALRGFSSEEINRMDKVLGLDSKSLAAQARALEYQAKVSGNDALKARAQELRLLNDEIGLHKDMLGLAQDYSDEVSTGAAARGEDPLVKAASAAMSAPVDFAKATAGQFMSDIGIGGDGLISRAVTEGISYVFNISSVEQAMSLKDREDSKRVRAMGVH